MQTGGSKLEPACRRSAVLCVTPQADPRIIAGFPDVTNEDAFVWRRGSHPAILIVDSVGNHVRIWIGAEPAQVHCFTVVTERPWPIKARFLRIRQRTALGETFPSVAIDQRGFVEEWRGD